MKPLLMQSLPNSGSTWFAALLSEYIPGCRYYDKEFFNPVCNIKHELVLREHFGSELVSCYRNIALPGGSGIDAAISSTWGAESYTFTKECNSAFKLPVFVDHFACFVFLRAEHNTFPPGRVRVWSFYEHAWHALRESGHHLTGHSIEQRAREAHTILTGVILEQAEVLGIPVIWWEDVFKDPQAVVEQLRAVTEVDDDMVDALSASARPKEKLFA
jgi:hypothetical protein